MADVSHDTIAKVKKINQQAAPEVKEALQSGEISINEGYNQVKRAEKEAKQEERRERKSYDTPTPTPAMRVKIALTIEPIIAAKAKERMLEGKKQYTSPPDKCPELATDKDNASVEDKCPQGLLKTKNQTRRENETNYQVAQIAQVSDKTVQRYKKIQEKASDDIKVENPVQIFGQGSEEKKHAKRL